MDKFKHQLPSDLMDRVWKAKRLPVLVDEAVMAVNAGVCVCACVCLRLYASVCACVRVCMPVLIDEVVGDGC